MLSTLSAHLLPALTKAEELASGLVVMIDVLRASTTITTALAAGAREVIPCADVEQAQQIASALKQKGVLPLLGGERGGLPIPGFDLGNSPNEYTSGAVRGKTVIFTTTNGTQALMVCGAAQRVLIGSFVNYSAVLGEFDGDLPIHLICAGTGGRITREDVLFAGAIIERLSGTVVDPQGLNDEARIAQDVWRNSMGAYRPPDEHASQRIAEVLQNCQGGRNLKNLGLQADIVDAATVDRFDFVPEFDPKTWRIAKPMT